MIQNSIRLQVAQASACEGWSLTRTKTNKLKSLCCNSLIEQASGSTDCGKSSLFCHSERSEESLFDLSARKKGEIPRFARNDKILEGFFPQPVTPHGFGILEGTAETVPCKHLEVSTPSLTPLPLNPVIDSCVKEFQQQRNFNSEVCEEGNSVRGGLGRRDGSLAQVTHGVDRRAIDADFVVHVRAGGPSADADIANRIAAPKLLPDEHVEA
jgi:hypothetical protein